MGWPVTSIPLPRCEESQACNELLLFSAHRCRDHWHCASGIVGKALIAGPKRVSKWYMMKWPWTALHDR